MVEESLGTVKVYMRGCDGVMLCNAKFPDASFCSSCIPEAVAPRTLSTVVRDRASTSYELVAGARARRRINGQVVVETVELGGSLRT